jgi:SAM-dependent methyltransferase
MSNTAWRRSVRHRLRRALRPAWLGTLRRTTPISSCWGYDRGRPIDRYYIDHFMAAHREVITGRVLEIKEPLYTRRFGSAVVQADVLDIDAENPHATLIADLADARVAPSAAFDCCIVTQTLQYVYDVSAAVRELHRMLTPGGVLLATVPGMTRLDPRATYPDFWRFTPDSCARLFGDVFGPSAVTVEGYGNVLSSIAFLEGIAQEELSAAELGLNDSQFPLVVTVRAVKEPGR